MVEPAEKQPSLADLLERVINRAVAEEPQSFAALARAAGLDPSRDFVGASLRDIDFRNENLRGFDFSKADLTRADFSGADVFGVQFNGAIIKDVIGLFLQKKTILIVEDQKEIADFVSTILIDNGYNTIITDDPIEAFRLTRKNMPSLITMDIALPEISGLELTKWIKEESELKKIPIVAITGFDMPGDKEKILGGGCDAYIAKPFSIRELMEVINSHII